MTKEKLARLICDAFMESRVDVFDDSYVNDDDLENVVLDGHFDLFLLADKILEWIGEKNG